MDDANDDDVVELTERQRELLAWLARGYNAAGIARMTAFSRGWVYAELRAVRESLNVRTDAGAVVEGLRLGVIGLPAREQILGS